MSESAKTVDSKLVGQRVDEMHFEHRHILGMRVHCPSYEPASQLLATMALDGRSGYVCVATVHMVMESFDDEHFRETVNGAILVTPDGMPLVWGLRLLGLSNAERVYGPMLTESLCRTAASRQIPIGFYGGTDSVLAMLKAKLQSKYPMLRIAYEFAPPFRTLTENEDQKVIQEIVASGAKILFVGLGCPKQERWMAEHSIKLPLVMLGVGAAFDFIAGAKPQAPGWMQNGGLEWLFRLISEPRRLWKRYLYHNPRFVYHFSRQLLGVDDY